MNRIPESLAGTALLGCGAFVDFVLRWMKVR